MAFSVLMTYLEMGEQILDQVIQSKETLSVLYAICHSDEQSVQRSLHPILSADVIQSCRWQSCSRQMKGEPLQLLAGLEKRGLEVLGAILVNGSR